MQHEFFLSSDANLPLHPILHAVNNFFNQLTIVFPFVKEESRSDFTSNFGTMKQRIKKFENPMDISVKLDFSTVLKQNGEFLRRAMRTTCSSLMKSITISRM